MNTIAELVRARAGDDARRSALRGRVVDVRRAASTRARSEPRSCSRTSPADAPFHVGVLLDNVPEFWIMLGAAALSGATLVGHQPDPAGRRARARHAAHRLRAARDRDRAPRPARRRGRRRCRADALLRRSTRRSGTTRSRRSRARRCPTSRSRPADVFMLIFTSGTTGAPKAVRMSHGKLAGVGHRTSPGRFPLTPDDVCYSVMPLFHSNAAVAGYTAPMAAGATTVLRRALLGERLPPRRPQVRRDVLQLRRQAAHLHPRDARRSPTTPTTRCGSRSATRPRRSTSTASPSASAASSSTATARPRAASTCRRPTTRRRARSACPIARLPRRDRRSRHRQRVRPRASSTSTAGCSTPRRRSARS